MTREDIRRRVEAIKTEHKGDDEVQHIEEDSLHQDVLAFIGSGKCLDPRGFAKEALKTKKLLFARWCA